MLVEVVKVTIGGAVSVTSLRGGIFGSGGMKASKLGEVMCAGGADAGWSDFGLDCSFRMRRGEGLSSGELMDDVVERGEEMDIGGPSGRMREGVR